MGKIFLLSPAQTSGRRAQLLFSPRARFALAHRLAAGETVGLGELFSFLSGLYFRGKLTYARIFAQPPAGIPGVWVITSNQGLLPAEHAITRAELKQFARVAIDHRESRYRRPLERAAWALNRQVGRDGVVVFLGSVSTRRYTEPLLGVFAERLKFPAEFVGRGDMSRGGLLLRCVADGQELEYVSVARAKVRGPRPPKLLPRRLLAEAHFVRQAGRVGMLPPGQPAAPTNSCPLEF